MKIILTGGGTGGHFYPIVAIAEQINELTKENHLVKPSLYFLSDESYNEGLLFDHDIKFKKISAGKIRRHLSFGNIILNIIDIFKTFLGSIKAFFIVFSIYPDVVFGKGAYVSFPALLAARILGIPVVIHESDTSPGKVNAWAGKFAKKIAVSYPESAKFFPLGKTAHTGNPVRKELQEPMSVGAFEYLGLTAGIPTVFVLGGSQGAKIINEVLMDALPDLVKKYQVIHQTGKKNYKIVMETKEVVLAGSENASRYKAFDYMDVLAMRMSAGACDLVVSRAGSTIFEIACWGKPSVIIPISETTSHDQRNNAYAYARVGAAVVIEEKNLTSHILISEIDRILENQEEKEKMSQSAKDFARRDSARLIAEEILGIALSHEQ